MVLKFSKKVHFLQFCADLMQKSKFVLKQLTYMDLKVFITVFQKMICLIGNWATVPAGCFSTLRYNKKLVWLLFSIDLFHFRWSVSVP